MYFGDLDINGCTYEAYSESKYRFAVKKNRVRFRIKFYYHQILHSSNCFSTNIRCHYRDTYRSGAQVFLYPPHRMRPPAMLATTDNVIE